MNKVLARYFEVKQSDRDKWIDVNDKLPENGKTVLCWYEYFRYGEYNRMFKTYGIGYQYNGHWGGEVSNGTKAKVLAWRELPDPPRMEESWVEK